MSQKNLFTRSALAVAVAVISSNASAAGFQLNEYSSSGLGRAFSGAGVVADNASEGSRNPAAMTLFDRPSFSSGLIYVNPNVDITGKSPVSQKSTDAKNIAPHAWIPNLHFITPINDQWFLGASATSNFGLATEFSNNYTAGPIGGKTSLKTVNLNLSGAYKLNEQFSFGLGVNAVYADATIVRHMGETGPAISRQLKSKGIPLSIPATAEGARLEGTDWGYGWNAGILYQYDENNRYSLTYRSKVKVKFNNGDFSNDLPEFLSNGTGGNTIKGTLDLNLPDMWEVSGYNRVAPQWAIHYSFLYTGWSEFKELRGKNKDNGKTLFHKDENFRNAYRVSLGTTYYYDDNWTFRTGIAFDESPAPAKNRSISIPDQDRFWLSVGSTYAFNKDASVDVGVSYMRGKKVRVSETLKDDAPAPFNQPYEFDSKGTAWLYGVNFNYTF
ncbi:long-chain fatty acid transporter FadL [Xenorhabdus bovienii]|uniref:long-chain fatty acid transporter FadL n=1 Tax=Xenorhabdus bovienii TaxID=40576 RepID=UPI0023B3044D|nr:long-chain fatty acid transporter FadL [Xenorhabdus bovienii]MDE9480205.1 long-chain fatty acid transporter FadL [Xenorhabdus bovienii]MDE9542571.1 long-chain fatty acid transporter FadL [Xenorhabdus bovienii]MDE9563101.1 long-chain fatty acid transporter FadL [Xenorhabdus bovienii]